MTSIMLYEGPTQASLDSVQEFYLAYFGFPADPGGLDFWAQKLDNSDDLTALLSEFGGANSFLDQYGELENDALINSLYQELFNRDADSQGLAFYLGRLESGEATLTSVAKQIIDGAKNGGDDATIFDNKVAVANCITDYIERTDYHYTVVDTWDAQLDSVGLEPVECEDVDYNPITEISVAGITAGEGDIFA